MKFNLKNLPEKHYYMLKEAFYYNSREVADWFLGFEKELREEIETCKRWMHADGRLERPKARFRLIKEILGE